MKICSRCNINKSNDCFNKDSRSLCGLRAECNECRKIDTQSYLKENKIEIKKRKKIYYDNNKNKINQKSKKYRKENPWIKTLNHIKDRCTNPNNKKYKNYGGRGIKNEFKHWEEIKFLWFRDKAYLMKQPSIDRIDNDGNYCIENCRFIEKGENSAKDKRIGVKQYDLKGNFIQEYISMSDAFRKTGVSTGCISNTVNKGQFSAGGYIWKKSYE